MTKQLSPKNSVALLKREAKRWLRSLQQHDPSALVRLHSAWPSAPENPTLRDVQLALAREYGLTDWKQLLLALDDFALDRQQHTERVKAVLLHGWDGDAARARRIVQRFPEVRSDNVFVAAACGDVDEVRRLLAHDPSCVTHTDSVRGWTPVLHVAYGRLDGEHAAEIARLLLDAGANPAVSFDDGWGNPFTPITGVIGLGEGVKPPHPQATELVTLLLERGADPFDTQALYNSSIVHDDIYWTALLWEHCDPEHRTALWTDAHNRSIGGTHKVGTLNYLLGNAVSNDHIARATWLLQHGANANTVHSYSGAPVHTEARLKGHARMATLLAQHGAKAEPLHGARALIAALMDDDVSTVRTIVKGDASLLQVPDVFFAAVSADRSESVALLLDLGASVAMRDAEGATALHRAAQAGALASVDVLLSAGADVDAREPRWQATAMEWACVMRRWPVASRLEPHTRDVRALVHNARVARLTEVLAETPTLAHEVRSGHRDPTPLFCLPDDDVEAEQITQLLLSHGANPHHRNAARQTAEQAARQRGLDDAADAMAEWAARDV